jgi:glucose-6-phosphate-specific signal transduction histidine kinase
VPGGAAAPLGWVVREGVTNVIKHSGGHRCEIDVRRDDRIDGKDGTITVTITDDGRASPATALPSGGHGLDGLRERIAAAGGTLTAGPVREYPAGGATVADIAARLFLSESTVRNYLSSAIGKTGTRNRIEAVRTARHNGWL